MPDPTNSDREVILSSLHNPQDAALRRRAWELASEGHDETEPRTPEEYEQEFIALYWRIPEDKRDMLMTWLELVVDDLIQETQMEQNR